MVVFADAEHWVSLQAGKQRNPGRLVEHSQIEHIAVIADGRIARLVTMDLHGTAIGLTIDGKEGTGIFGRCRHAHTQHRRLGGPAGVTHDIEHQLPDRRRPALCGRFRQRAGQQQAKRNQQDRQTGS